MSLMFPTQDLGGRTVLIVEDEAILALDLQMIVEEAGGRVAGPYHRVPQALSDGRLTQADVAVLDIDLDGETVAPVADRLSRAGVPFLFHTARRSLDGLPRRLRAAPVCPKPSNSDRLVTMLSCLCGATSERRAFRRTAASRSLPEKFPL